MQVELGKDAACTERRPEKTVEVDEEEEYMKSLNAALLIQTPLQVSLEMIQKRLRKQSKAIEDVRDKIQKQEIALLDVDSVSARLQRAEEGVADLRSSKLSPFVLTEVLGRMEALERRLKDEAHQWKVQIESLRLDQKLELIRNKHFIESESSQSSEDTESTHSADKEVCRTPEQESCPFSQETLDTLEQTIGDLEKQVEGVQDHLGTLESNLEEKVKSLKSQHAEWKTVNQHEMDSVKKLIKSRKEGSYSDFVKMNSRLEFLEHQLNDIQQGQASDAETTAAALKAIQERLSSLEATQHIQEKRIETAMSAALSASQMSKECVTEDKLEELREELAVKPMMAEIKKLIQDEVTSSLESIEAKLTQKRSNTPKAVHAAGRATRLICLSCDRELTPPLQEVSQEHPSVQGLLPCTNEFKTKAMSQLQPLGPGLNAAELRKLHFLSINENNVSLAESKKNVTRAANTKSADSKASKQVFLFDDEATVAKEGHTTRKDKKPELIWL